MGRSKSERELRWREILKRQADSGLSVRKFCTTERISEPSFYAWRKKLRAPKNNVSRARTASRPNDQSDNGRLFVPLQVVDAAQVLEIIHPLGYRIQVTDDVNVVALRRVIEALDERRTR